MRIVMIGEAGQHQGELVEHLSAPHDITTLPAQAASDPAYDADLDGADVVISLRLTRPEDRWPPFGLLHVPGAGLDGIALAQLPETVAVCNVYEHEIPIAEFVMSSLLEWEIDAPRDRAAFTDATWSALYRDRRPHGELHGRTMTLIGLGRVGRAIAARAAAFGIRILAVDDYADRATTPDHVTLVDSDQLTTALRAGDYVVLACPLTDETRGLLDGRTLSSLRPRSVLINVSRAEIVDEDALFAVLSEGRIGGAFLDVWYRYPQGVDDHVEPSHQPLLSLPNARCTPHISAWTRQLPRRRYAFIADNLNRLADGRTLRNVVRSGSLTI